MEGMQCRPGHLTRRYLFRRVGPTLKSRAHDAAYNVTTAMTNEAYDTVSQRDSGTGVSVLTKL